MDASGPVFVFWLLSLFVYFAPSIVAFNRSHVSKGGIVVINLFLGWTFIGWVIALAWAFSGRHGK
ncbi:superinfection immunity protein [Azospirillum argentinense]|uniref:Superinfection immunity protein n=1 Tax=Azospirillum argentinense TaxID=2970906 RepID=A0ABW8VHR8_9PROT